MIPYSSQQNKNSKLNHFNQFQVVSEYVFIYLVVE